jgi:hypothetical protein
MEDEKRNSVISKKGGTGVLVNKQRSVDWWWQHAWPHYGSSQLQPTPLNCNTTWTFVNVAICWGTLELAWIWVDLWCQHASSLYGSTHVEQSQQTPLQCITTWTFRM